MKRKAANRASNMGALVSAPISDDDGPESVSVSVHPISNGFISTHSESARDGGYRSTETYHASRPKVEEIMGSAREVGKVPEANHLRGAVALLNRKRV